MRLFSYRNRNKFKKVLTVVLLTALALLLLAAGVLAYLDRYVVYDHDGAHIDRSWNSSGSDQTSEPVTVQAEVQYVSSDDEVAIGTSRKITGYYVTTSMLQDLDAVRATLNSGSYYAVLLDLKDDYGNYYYDSGLSGAKITSSVDAAAVSQFIAELKSQNVYLIARIPAFADQTSCLGNTDLGLPLESGALWADGNGCYWMDPGKPAVLSYLENICTELQTLGFREVVLDRFQFPQADSIVYDETAKTKDEVLADAALQLQTDLSVMELRVSFGVGSETAFPTQLTESRLYLSLEDGSLVDGAVKTQSAAVVTPATQLVFVTESRDTRFDDYGHLSPAIESDIPTEDS